MYKVFSHKLRKLIFKDGEIVYQNELTIMKILKFILLLIIGLFAAGFGAWAVSHLFR